ncbi:hypothetical protein M885DRAFT_615927 [Pelagophyceae sp. CCMP2097]|nr:hypothetical protein M885DRAFT_615927 [Pelagophyceae sp. CCMP2097]
MILHALAAVVIATSSLAPPSGLAPSIKPCFGEHDCVSSNGLEAPNHFAAPLAFTSSRSAAANAAASLLRGRGCAVEADAFAVRASCDRDDYEIVVREDKLATFRVSARSKSAFVSPWCIKKGCINGNMPQRNAILELAAQLGWSPSDSTEMEDDSKWTPIFFNTDAVPHSDDLLYE